MIKDFLTANRTELIRRMRIKVASRSSPPHTPQEISSGIPLFLDQLSDLFDLPDGSSTAVIGATAKMRGEELLKAGYTISHVVHDYGDVCQAVTELATDTRAPISVEEFHTLNRCLDDAIAGAVTAWSELRAAQVTAEETERTGVFAHELRNRLSAATHAFDALKSGRVGVGGSTSAVVDRNLRGMKTLINTSLAEVRIDAGLQDVGQVLIADVLKEIDAGASLDAACMGIDLFIAPPKDGIAVLADRAVFSSAVGNLLQNAFKFSHANGRAPRVWMRIVATADRVHLDVEDECGGLPDGNHEDLFLPYTQRGANRKGMGLGLFSSRKGMEATGGYIRVRDLPGIGCVFTIDMPRYIAS